MDMNRVMPATLRGPYCSDSDRGTEEGMLKCMRHKDYAICFVRRPGDWSADDDRKGLLIFEGLTEAEVLIVARTLVSHCPETFFGSG